VHVTTLCYSPLWLALGIVFILFFILHSRFLISTTKPINQKSTKKEQRHPQHLVGHPTQHTRTHAHTCMHVHTHTHARSYTHTRVHTHTHAQTTHAHAHIHTHPSRIFEQPSLAQTFYTPLLIVVQTSLRLSPASCIHPAYTSLKHLDSPTCLSIIWSHINLSRSSSSTYAYMVIWSNKHLSRSFEPTYTCLGHSVPYTLIPVI
jgi:hypothetical protein